MYRGTHGRLYMKHGNWDSFYKEGIAYCDRAMVGDKNGYTAELLHGIVSMAAEKLLMALLLYHNRMPEGHTFIDLVSAAAGICDIDESLKSDLFLIDEMIPLCSLDPARSWKIDPSLKPRIMTTLKKTRNAVDNALCDRNTATT